MLEGAWRSQARTEVFSIFLFVRFFFLKDIHICRNKKILERSKKLFNAIAFKQADVTDSYFSSYTLCGLFEIFGQVHILFFWINKIVYKAKYQKKNYLILHKSSAEYRNISTVPPIKTELQFHSIIISILLENINALTINILSHWYFSICGKIEPIYILLGFFQMSAIYGKNNRVYCRRFQVEKNKHDLISIKS